MGTLPPRAFFWLWLGVVVSSVGSWAQTVGAQWLFVHDPNAATIVSVNVNVARAAGPALAGLVIAQWGVPPVFALTAVSGAFLAVVLMRWRRPRVSRGEREPFLRLWWPVGAACVTSLWFKGSCFAWPPWVALPLLVVCGFGWTAIVSTVISEVQLFLPGWVRARAIAIYLMVFLGSQAVASPIWGLVTQHLGLRVAVLAAASVVGVSAIGGLVLKVPENQHLDRSPAAYWGPATVALEPAPGAGPIVVSIEYEVGMSTCDGGNISALTPLGYTVSHGKRLPRGCPGPILRYRRRPFRWSPDPKTAKYPATDDPSKGGRYEEPDT